MSDNEHFTHKPGSPGREVAVYEYRCPGGHVMFEKVRFEPKGFLLRHREGGVYVDNIKDRVRLPYRLDRWYKGSQVVICEGEKDADALADLGFASTSGPFGAKSWPEELTSHFTEKDVYILYDVGEEAGAEAVAAALYGVAHSIHICDLGPGRPREFDVSDLLNTIPREDKAKKKAAVQEILRTAKVYGPPFPEKGPAQKKQVEQRGTGEGGKSNVKTNIRCFKDIAKCPIEWLWPGRFPLGMLSLIAGYQGRGKSTFGIWMASRLSRGDGWPDGPGYSHPVDSLLITSEDPAEQVIKYRIEAAGGDDSHIFQMDAVLDKDEEFPFDFNKHLPQLEEELRKNQNIKFILIDPLASHMGGAIDANDMNRVRWSLSGLARCAKRSNVAIIGIAHFKKNEDVEEVLNKIAGSYQFSSLPRAVWMIMEDKNDQGEPKRRHFLPGKTNPCQPKPGFSFCVQTVRIDDQETGRIVIDTERPKFTTASELHAKNRDARPSKEKNIEKLILDYLEYGPCPSAEVDSVIVENGFSSRTAERVKTALREAGKIKFKKDGPGWHIYLPSAPGRFGDRT